MRDTQDNGSGSSSESDASSSFQRAVAASHLMHSPFSSFMSGDSMNGMGSGGSSKRRGGSSFGGSSRDAKSRRREDSFGTGLGRRGPPGPVWEQRDQGPARQKDELVDMQIVDNLRAEFGDPFDDSIFEGSV